MAVQLKNCLNNECSMCILSANWLDIQLVCAPEPEKWFWLRLTTRFSSLPGRAIKIKRYKMKVCFHIQFHWFWMFNSITSFIWAGIIGHIACKRHVESIKIKWTWSSVLLGFSFWARMIGWLDWLAIKTIDMIECAIFLSPSNHKNFHLITFRLVNLPLFESMNHCHCIHTFGAFNLLLRYSVHTANDGNKIRKCALCHLIWWRFRAES